VTARSRERGSHAGRPRGYSLPFPIHGLGTQTPVRPGGEDGIADPVAPGVPGATEAPADPTAVPDVAGLPTGSGTAPSPDSAARPANRRHRHRPERKSLLSGKQRMAAVLALVVAGLAVGFSTGFGSEESAEPAVEAFLLDWQQGKYAQAAAFTNGSADRVSAELAAAHTDVDATNAFFAMKSVSQHGSTAVAQYQATVDLAQPGEQWTYTGQFRLSSVGGQWVIDWTPQVINPALAPGDRLAVVTSFPRRAQVTDMNGRSLVAESGDYHIGVFPARLTNEVTTAAKFSKATGLDEQQVLGEIQAAPPDSFLSLLTLQTTGSDGFTAQWPALSKVPGLGYVRQTERLFDSLAQQAVGDVGTEVSPVLRAEGAAYQPGVTVGQSGLEQIYQDDLVGTPTTSVVVVNSAGARVATLWSSPGHAGTPVQTTLSTKDQEAAVAALADQPSAGEIVAVDASNGDIRALASRQRGATKLPSALNGKVAPGMSFSIVSAAALLTNGVPEKEPLPCQPTTTVGGVTFSYQAAASSTSTFESDFAAGCGTAFATLSRTLSASRLTSVEHAFGIGLPWDLKVPAFSGSATAAAGPADLAAQTIGQSGVLMSPLGMAMVAAEVDSGVGRSPQLVVGGTPATWSTPLSATSLAELRQLMRLAVVSGAAHQADLRGAQVYGQAGTDKMGAHSYLSWFVGYRGDMAVAAIETGTSADQAAAALAGAFLKTVG
jgi:cell division protein FtsI/penicillin-binding protein 2